MCGITCAIRINQLRSARDLDFTCRWFLICCFASLCVGTTHRRRARNAQQSLCSNHSTFCCGTDFFSVTLQTSPDSTQKPTSSSTQPSIQQLNTRTKCNAQSTQTQRPSYEHHNDRITEAALTKKPRLCVHGQSHSKAHTYPKPPLSQRQKPSIQLASTPTLSKQLGYPTAFRAMTDNPAPCNQLSPNHTNQVNPHP